MAPVKAFSKEWCSAVQEACNADNSIYLALEDAEEFTYKMEYVCSDRDIATQIEWQRGKITSWSPKGIFTDEEVDIVLTAALSAWENAANGVVDAGTLMAQGLLSMTKGPLQVALSNGDALENFVMTWGKVPTDWNV